MAPIGMQKRFGIFVYDYCSGSGIAGLASSLKSPGHLYIGQWHTQLRPPRAAITNRFSRGPHLVVPV